MVMVGEVGVTKLCIAVLLMSMVVSQNCNNSLQVRSSHNNCHYSVKYFSEDTCKIPLFINCTVTSQFHTYPLNLSFVDVTQCSAYCCEDNQYFVFCSTVKASQQSTLMVVVAVVAGVIVLGILGICYYRCYQEMCFCCRRICCPIKKSVANSNNECQHNETVDNFESQSNQWKEGTKLSTFEECAVCLCANPNLVLFCGHIFHKECISECLKRKRECILCRSKELLTFRIYCHLCYQSYRIISELQLGKSYKIQSTCNNCCDKDEIKDEE